MLGRNQDFERDHRICIIKITEDSDLIFSEAETEKFRKKVVNLLAAEQFLFSVIFEIKENLYKLPGISKRQINKIYDVTSTENDKEGAIRLIAERFGCDILNFSEILDIYNRKYGKS